jgi:hypothetical protein
MNTTYFNINSLMPELNPSAQRCLPRFFTGDLIFKGFTARRLYKSFGVKGLRVYAFYPTHRVYVFCMISRKKTSIFPKSINWSVLRKGLAVCQYVVMTVAM